MISNAMQFNEDHRSEYISAMVMVRDPSTLPVATSRHPHTHLIASQHTDLNEALLEIKDIAPSVVDMLINE